MVGPNVLLFVIMSMAVTKQAEQIEYAPQVRLYHFLKAKYINGVRPNKNATKVVVDPAVYSVVDVDEASETLAMAQWFELTWSDDLLSWNPMDFDGLTSVRLQQEMIWVPDITIYQLLYLSRTSTAQESFVTVHFNGTVFLSRAEKIGVHCGFEVSSFPYDTQNCSMTYVAWSYPDDEIILEPGPVARTQFIQQSGEWELLTYHVEWNHVDYGIGHWYEVTYHISIQRKPFYYIVTLTVPSYFITDLAIIGEKVSIGLTALLTMAVILMMVCELMPKNASRFPQLGKFILFEMAIMGCCTILGVLIMYLASQGYLGRRVPSWLLSSESARLRIKRKASSDYTAITYANNVSALDDAYPPPSKPSTQVRSSSVYKSELLFQAYQVTQMVRNIQAYFGRLELEKTEQDEIIREWTSLCYQLDILALVGSICVNTAVAYAHL